MRRTILGLALLILGAGLQVLAQHTDPHWPIPGRAPKAPARPALRNALPSSDVVFDATRTGSPLLLDKGWRVGISADPTAATPQFDDSAWAVRNSQDSFADVPDEEHGADAPDDGGKNPSAGNAAFSKAHQRPFAWFRIHVQLAPDHGPVSLLIELPPSQSGSISAETIGVDVFANGKLIRPDGPHGDTADHYQQISRIYDLNVPPQ